MAWMHTCCWTDHSKGCPAKVVPLRKNRIPIYTDDEVGARQWWLDDCRARIRMGYSQPMTDEELRIAADKFMRFTIPLKCSAMVDAELKC
jgi:hypothetical protein